MLRKQHITHLGGHGGPDQTNSVSYTPHCQRRHTAEQDRGQTLLPSLEPCAATSGTHGLRCPGAAMRRLLDNITIDHIDVFETSMLELPELVVRTDHPRVLGLRSQADVGFSIGSPPPPRRDPRHIRRRVDSATPQNGQAPRGRGRDQAVRPAGSVEVSERVSGDRPREPRHPGAQLTLTTSAGPGSPRLTDRPESRPGRSGRPASGARPCGGPHPRTRCDTSACNRRATRSNATRRGRRGVMMPGLLVHTVPDGSCSCESRTTGRGDPAGGRVLPGAGAPGTGQLIRPPPCRRHNPPHSPPKPRDPAGT